MPGQEPGDIVFTLDQKEHEVFERRGADLCATMQITLAEALCGFSRVVVKHLDGRGISMKHPQANPRVLEPGQVIKVPNEGMPQKKSDLKGDLYLIVEVKFPDYSWLERNQALSKLKGILPKPESTIESDDVDDVDYDESANLEEFGAGEAEEGDWEDDEEEEAEGGPQCKQQ